MLLTFSTLQFENLFTECSKIVLPLPRLTIFHEFCKYYSNIILHNLLRMMGKLGKSNELKTIKQIKNLLFVFYTVDTGKKVGGRMLK